MPLYFMLLKDASFHDEIVPALGASWRRRSFHPCRSLCTKLLPTVHKFAQQFHIDPAETAVNKVLQGMPFDPDRWKLLVGEILFYAASEIPEIETAPETLMHLLSARDEREPGTTRERFHPIQQAHYGSRGLEFGSR